MGKYTCSGCVLKLRQKLPLRRHTFTFHRDDIRAPSVTPKLMQELLRKHTIVPHKEKYKCNDCDMEDSDQGACWNSQNGMRDG